MVKGFTCLVCFEDLAIFENGRMAAIKCIDTTCSGIICNDCMIGYITAANEIPKCISTKCDAVYPLSSISHLGKETVDKYCDLTLNYLTTTESVHLEKKVTTGQIIENLRKERQKFIADSFPKAVAHVAVTFMNSKFVKMEKDLAKKMQRQITDVNKHCFNLACDGRLNEHFKCLKCDETFCEKCERSKSSFGAGSEGGRSGHTCKQQDLDSVAAVNAMAKCPRCKTFVFKDIGCNHIHCIKCGAHFDYATGQSLGDEEADWGEQPANAAVQWDPAKKLSIVYKDRLSPNAFDLLFKFESNRPTIPPMQSVHRAVIDKNPVKTAQLLDKIITTKYKYKNHIAVLNHVEKKLLAAAENDKLTIDDIKYFIN